MAITYNLKGRNKYLKKTIIIYLQLLFLGKKKKARDVFGKFCEKNLKKNTFTSLAKKLGFKRSVPLLYLYTFKVTRKKRLPKIVKIESLLICCVVGNIKLFNRK